MSSIQISQVAQLPPDTPIPQIQGRVRKWLKAKTGQNDFGAWSFQRLYIVDPQGYEAPVVLKDRDELPNCEGKHIVLNSQQKQGSQALVGVKIKSDKDKEGNPQNVVWVTEKALIQFDISPTGESAPQQTGQPAQSAPAPQQTQQSASGPPDAIQEAKRMAMQIANQYLVASMAADYLADKHGISQEDASFLRQYIAVRLDRENVYQKLPYTPIK